MTDRKINVLSNFYNVSEDKQTTIRTIVSKNIDGKMDAYLKKVISKSDAEVCLDYKIHQNKQGRYEAKFLFNCDGKSYIYSNKMAFKYVEDLVNHAFEHFKLALSK